MPYDNIISRTDSQALVPEDVSNRLLQGMINQSASLTLFPRVPMARNQQRMPVLSALPTAYFVNGDTGLKQTSEQAWSNKFLNVEELAVIIPIPENVLDDTSYDVWGSIQPNMEQAIGRALDAAIFFGVNAPASWPTNVVAGAIAAGNQYTRGTNNAAAGGIAADISNLMGLIEADGYDAQAAIANRTWRGLLRNVRDSVGDRLLEVNPTDMYGTPVTYPMRGLWPTGSDVAEMIVGDYAGNGILGVRSDFTYKMLTEAVIQDNTGAIIYNLAQQDMVAMRLTFRVAWQIANIINYDQSDESARYPFGVMLTP